MMPQWARALRPELNNLLFGSVCMVVLAACTAATAFLVGPILQTMLGNSAQSPTGFEGGLASTFGRLLPHDKSYALPMVLVALGLCKGAAYLGQFFSMARAGQRTASRLRLATSAALVRAGPDYLLAQRTGELLARLTMDISAVEMAVTYALAAYVRDILTALFLVLLCIVLDWRLALVAFAGLPLALWPLGRLMRGLRVRLRQARQGQGLLGHRLAEGLQGLPAIQVDRLEARERERFVRLSRRTLRRLLAGAKLRALSGPLMELLAVAGLCVMLVLASSLVARGALSPERLTSFLAAALMLAQPIKSVGKVSQFAIAGLTAWRHLDELQEAARGSVLQHGDSLQSADALRGAIEFREVFFRYGPEQPDVLSGLTLQLRRGERLALVGESGAGKSTAVALLLGLRRPTAGIIAYDGRDTAGIDPESLRRQVAWMGQEPLCFDGTAAENIALGDEHPDPERLLAAARRGQSLGFILRAGGFDAQVGERGRLLSGGERQRLCIARALYLGAGVLVLDEPTSQLDAENEQALEAALAELLANRTALVIAHRLSTVRRCDRVAVLRDGRIVQEGPPQRLLESPGPFAELMSRQQWAVGS
jgi:subfamily B ATP-binding cassette protein MsbA